MPTTSPRRSVAPVEAPLTAYRFAPEKPVARIAGDTRTRSMTGRRVVIAERVLTHYRIAFYQRLREFLAQEGVDLQLVVGNGTALDAKKKDSGKLDWAIRIPETYLLGDRLFWQPFGPQAKAADLVIVIHENRMLYNLWLLFFNRPRRLAFWGHGRNMQSTRPGGLRERFKRWTINRVDWWFAYTDMSAAMIREAGFPVTRTTVVDNAVDTNEIITLCNQVTTADCQRLRRKLGISSAPLGIFLGSLYQEKRLDFLITAAERIRERIPDFQLLIAGAGPEQPMIETVTRLHRWISYAGPLHGKDKATALVTADVMLNPGLVGLGILDSFVSGTPMFTTDCGMHSPEICYLVSGRNGVMTLDDVELYAGAVADAMSNPAVLADLADGARASAPLYTVENMAKRFAGGVLACMAVDKSRKENQ